jgi:hypothetical protein
MSIQPPLPSRIATLAAVVAGRFRSPAAGPQPMPARRAEAVPPPVAANSPAPSFAQLGPVTNPTALAEKILLCGRLRRGDVDSKPMFSNDDAGRTARAIVNAGRRLRNEKLI